MTEDLKQECTGVICLHCGMQTRLPESTSRKLPAGSFKKSSPSISLIRCNECGKEAPYLADEIVAFKETPDFARYAA